MRRLRVTSWNLRNFRERGGGSPKDISARFKGSRFKVQERGKVQGSKFKVQSLKLQIQNFQNFRIQNSEFLIFKVIKVIRDYVHSPRALVPPGTVADIYIDIDIYLSTYVRGTGFGALVGFCIVFIFFICLVDLGGFLVVCRFFEVLVVFFKFYSFFWSFSRFLEVLTINY